MNGLQDSAIVALEDRSDCSQESMHAFWDSIAAVLEIARACESKHERVRKRKSDSVIFLCHFSWLDFRGVDDEVISSSGICSGKKCIAA